MDFTKKFIIYASILGVLAVLFAVGTIVQAVNLEPQGVKLFPELQTDGVEKITVTDQKGTVVITKEGGTWKVESGGKTYEAAKTAVETLLKNFGDVRRRNVVTSNADQWVNFNVDDANAVRIVLSGTGGAALADCYFGKGGSTSFSQYVRLPGGPDIIQTDIRIEKTTRLKEWAEMRLFPEAFYVADVERVMFKSSLLLNDQAKGYVRALSYTLIAGEKDKEGYTTWKMAENERFPLSPQKVSNFVNSIVGLTGDDIVTDRDKLKLTPAHQLGSVVVRLKSGQTKSLLLLGRTADDPDTYYVTNQDEKYVYTVTNWSIRTIFSDATSLLDVEAALTGRR